MSGTRRTSVGDHSNDNLETWWRQPGCWDTAGGANIATRNHVASAAWSADKSDVGGNSVFDLSAQIVRLKGATVLLVLVYMTNGPKNVVEVWQLVYPIRSNNWSFLCMGDWDMTPEEMIRTDMMCSFGAISNKLAGVDHLLLGQQSPGPRLFSVCGRSVVTVEPGWPVQWKSHVALENRIHAARTLTMNIAFIPKGIQQNRSGTTC